MVTLAAQTGGGLSKNTKILIINGPNLNLLGTREPEIYGATTLGEIEADCLAVAQSSGMEASCVQSNSEGAIVDHIQAARSECAGIVINPGAYTHTSVAILDALLASELPVVEIHLSNIHAREAFRNHSYVSKAATGVICGFGADGYAMAITAMARLLKISE